MHTLSSPRPDLARPSRRALLVVLAVALLLAQALGLMHRTLHGGSARAASVVAAVAPAQGQGVTQGQADTQARDAGEPRTHAHGWLGALFPSHSDADCRLFDPLHHDGMPAVPLQVLPLLLTSFILAASTGDFVARWAALFDARGPPATR